MLFTLTSRRCSTLSGLETQMLKHLMVLRTGDVDTKWMTYRWTVVTFGERPASSILDICKDLAADADQHINPQAAKAIKEDTYIYDGATGGS